MRVRIFWGETATGADGYTFDATVNDDLNLCFEAEVERVMKKKWVEDVAEDANPDLKVVSWSAVGDKFVFGMEWRDGYFGLQAIYGVIWTKFDPNYKPDNYQE